MQRPEDAIETGLVEAVMDAAAPSVRSGAPLADAVDALVANPANRAVYVVDEAGKPLGAVSFRSVLRAVNARLGARSGGPVSLVRYFRDLTADAVDDLMRDAPTVRRSTSLPDALRTLEESRENDLAVVDDDGKLVGLLRGATILRLAAGLVREGDEKVAKGRKGA